jgi:hypothetical protein
MSILDNFYVEGIPSSETYEWLLKKHYAHRIPPISYAFGLFDISKTLQGICTYGVPISPELKMSCSILYIDKFFELNRLCVNDGLPKNTLSYFLSQTFTLLPKPLVIVSYADSSKNHHGYIYQATNWMYTGMSIEIEDYMVKGLEHLHGASIMDSVGRSDDGKEYTTTKVERLKEKYGDRLYKMQRPRKYRYFMFLGNKKDIKDMKRNLKYSILPYPKGDNQRYDASHEVKNIQKLLF